MSSFKHTLLVLGLVFSPVALADPAGNGFGSFGLVDGNPSFRGCLNGEQCADNFFKFLNQATLEQGFAMQGGTPLSSSAVNHQEGWAVGGMLQTFPFAPPRTNLSGKTENTQFSPVMPKLAVARLWDAGERHIGVGLTALPPIKVKGASALVVGLNGAVAWDTEGGRLGLEADLSVVQAKAPISASDEQMGDSDQFADGHLDRATADENCDADTGCIDTFTMANLELLARWGWAVGDSLVPYAAVGITVLNERLHIQYDDTAWSAFGLQPTVHLGGAWTPGDAIFLSTGTSIALRQGNQSPDGLGIFYRIEGSAAYRF